VPESHTSWFTKIDIGAGRGPVGRVRRSRAVVATITRRRRVGRSSLARHDDRSGPRQYGSARPCRGDPTANAAPRLGRDARGGAQATPSGRSDDAVRARGRWIPRIARSAGSGTGPECGPAARRRSRSGNAITRQLRGRIAGLGPPACTGVSETEHRRCARPGPEDVNDVAEAPFGSPPRRDSPCDETWNRAARDMESHTGFGPPVSRCIATGSNTSRIPSEPMTRSGC
jgi:hypothetical protein